MKTPTWIRVACGVASMYLMSNVALAESNVDTEFNALDQDGDGSISINEASGRLDLLKKWVDADTNADGKLERSEFSAFEELPAKTFEPVQPENPEPGAGPTQ